MSTKNIVETTAVSVLALCALVVTVLVAKRELSPPPDPRAPRKPVMQKDWVKYTDIGDRIGPASARATILVFSDFQCPFCKRFALVMDSVLAVHAASDVSVVFRHLPITSLHPFARPAAIAAQCAGKQGRFKEYHDVLFHSQDSIGVTPWELVARNAVVPDSIEFSRCLTSPQSYARLRADSLAGQELEVSGTPTVIVNGWRFGGTPTVADIEAVLKK